MLLRFLSLTAAAVTTAAAVNAQTVSTFEQLTLPNNDTAYVNYSMPGQDVGFSSGLAYFPCRYDTGFGFKYWGGGFVYSNKKDTVTSGLPNQYSAKAGSGSGGSQKYLVAYGSTNRVILTGAARGGKVSGVFVTNSTYTYNSMRNGDAFARKFGDTTGTRSGLPQGAYPDYFLLTAKGYRNGALTTDSVDFYLADYRSSNSANDYIVKNWTWMPLDQLGRVDSLQFRLRSSDVGQFGMNTPAYFCMDDFTTNETNIGVGAIPAAAVRVFPNPATDRIFIEDASAKLQHVAVTDVAGRMMWNVATDNGSKAEIETAGWPAGVYFIQLQGANGSATVRIVKN
jgi:hypothetical protein